MLRFEVSRLERTITPELYYTFYCPSDSNLIEQGNAIQLMEEVSRFYNEELTAFIGSIAFVMELQSRFGQVAIEIKNEHELGYVQ